MDFKIGDRVHVSNNGCSFTTYSEFFKRNGLEYFKKDWVHGEIIPIGDYTVAAIGKHHASYYGTLYLLRSERGKIHIATNLYRHLTLIEEGEKKLKAYDLMKLAAENPQRYEGKRYKTVEYFALDGSGKARPVALVREGSLIFPDCTSAYITSKTTFEEIKPEPQPVSFMEARKAAIEGKRPFIVLDNIKYTLIADKGLYDVNGYWLKVKSGNNITYSISTGMLDGMWTVQ
ncbi:MAG: hypothetical protein WC365_00715 [Candidatus Babeliales bacterium]|jgi:hypothetical protein